MSKLIYPDYKNCIANLPNSILKKFGAETKGSTLPLLDPYLEKEYENIVVILLDGMGKAIVERHLSEDGPFRTHLAGIYKSTFLSTTVAATTSMMSGLQPCEHSWLGWDCYYPQVDKNVTVFLNVEQGTDIPAADYNLAWTTTPYENVTQQINRQGGQAYITAPFLDPSMDSYEKLCDSIRSYAGKPGKKYIYGYWNQPDGKLHRFGCGSDEVHENILMLEAETAKLVADLPNSLIVVTADHGHIDNEQVMIKDYPQLAECLTHLPSLEPRVLNLFVKPEKEAFFIAEFNRLFGDRFDLMPMDEAIEKGLFGTGEHHPQFRPMLGNYIAIATGDLSIMTVEEKFVSMHGSLTEDEMLIPLIVFET